MYLFLMRLSFPSDEISLRVVSDPSRRGKPEWDERVPLDWSVDNTLRLSFTHSILDFILIDFIPILFKRNKLNLIREKCINAN